MVYRRKEDLPPFKIMAQDIVEFPANQAWVATRFALKERTYTDPPPKRIVRRYRLNDLPAGGIERLIGFCEENKISARFMTKTAARLRPHPNKAENDRLMRESHGILYEIEA